MAAILQLANDLTKPQPYFDKKSGLTEEEVKLRESVSTTVYVGNLTFFTSRNQIYQVFSQCGPIRNIIIGENKQDNTPCGFCFIDFYERQSALDAIKWITRTYLDGRMTRVDIDRGFEEGRQYGRGKNGAQRRDDFRDKEDPDRPIQNDYRRRPDRFRR